MRDMVGFCDQVLLYTRDHEPETVWLVITEHLAPLRQRLFDLADDGRQP